MNKPKGQSRLFYYLQQQEKCLELLIIHYGTIFISFMQSTDVLLACRRRGCCKENQHRCRGGIESLAMWSNVLGGGVVRELRCCKCIPMLVCNMLGAMLHAPYITCCSSYLLPSQSESPCFHWLPCENKQSCGHGNLRCCRVYVNGQIFVCVWAVLLQGIAAVLFCCWKTLLMMSLGTSVWNKLSIVCYSNEGMPKKESQSWASVLCWCSLEVFPLL